MPFMPADMADTVINTTTNYWNGPARYLIGKMNNNLCLFGWGLEGRGDILTVGSYPSINLSSYFMFWGKHIYIFGSQIFCHLDSTNSTSTPSNDTNFYPGNIIPGAANDDGTYVSMYFIPYGNVLYIVYNSKSWGWTTRATGDGYNFAVANLPFLTPASITGNTIARGEDISRRLGIISAGNTWYAYDHMAGAQLIPIISTPRSIESLVSVNGIYLAQEYSGTTSVAKRLWVAYAP
jgi:hypothetical protein